MRHFSVALSALCLTVAAHAAEARPATCLLEVGGSVIIEGNCDFTNIDTDGSFQIAANDGRYFAQVLVVQPGFGEGYWNLEPTATHAHAPLGTLRRTGACWANAETTICAW